MARRARLRSPKLLLYFGLVATTFLAHIGVLAFVVQSRALSNLVQLIAPLLTLVLCRRRASYAPDAYFRGLWNQLAVAFLIWSGAQGYFLFSLILLHRTPTYPSASDFFWLLFSFPLLLVTMTRRSRATWQWVDWLDAAQAGTCFCVLFVLVYAHPLTLSVLTAYNVQSAVLLLVCALRYSSTPRGSERLFYRNLGAVPADIWSVLGNGQPVFWRRRRSRALG